jgi:Ca2+-binding RTX toxin-like protein
VAQGLFLSARGNIRLSGFDIQLGASGTELIINGTGVFTLAFTVNADRNGARIEGITNTLGRFTSATVSLAGRPTVGTETPELWKLTLDATELRYFARPGDTLADVAQGLAAALASSSVAALYQIAVTGSDLTITRPGGAAFVASFSVTPSYENSSLITHQVLFAPSQWSSLAGILSGTGAPDAALGSNDAIYVDTDTNETYLKAGDVWVLLKAWNTDQTVFVAAIDDPFVDGSDALVFPAPEQRVNAIRGPLIINGGIGVAEDAFLNDPFRLPGETNFPLPDGRIFGFRAAGPQDVFTDIYAVHTLPVYGERLGFDPRVNLALYNVTFLEGGAFGSDIDLRTLVGTSQNILTVSFENAFKSGFTASRPGAITFTGIPVASQVGQVDWRSVMVSLTGFVNRNEAWNVTLDGQVYTIRTVTLDEADITGFTTLLSRLTTQSDAVAADIWGRFSAAARALLSDANASDASKLATLIEQLNSVILGPSIYSSALFQGVPLSSESQNLINQQVTGEAGFRLNRSLLVDAFADLIAPDSATLLEMVEKLRAVLPSDYLVDFFTSVFGNRVIITHKDGNAFRFDFASDATSGTNATVRGTPVTPGNFDWLQAAWVFNGEIQPGDIFSINFAGLNFSYTVPAVLPADPIAAITNALMAAIMADPVGQTYQPGITGDSLRMVQPIAQPFTITASAGISIAATPARGNPALVERAELTLSTGSVAAGQIFSVALDGAAYQYTVRPGDRLADVLAGLRDAIPAAYLPEISAGILSLKAIAVGDTYFYAPVNLNTRVVEALQVDTVNLFNNDSPADDRGVLTEDRITGLGMGGTAIIGGRIFEGGITYSNLEAVNIFLGSGNDDFTVESTHRARTFISAGDGSDIVTVKTILGHTIIQTGAGDDVINLRSDDLVLDQLSGMLVTDGGTGNDTLNVHDNASIGLLLTTAPGVLSVAEPQTLTVYAANGRYLLRTVGFGIESALPASTGITRFPGYAEAQLEFGISAAQLEQALRALFGSNNIIVSEVRTASAVAFAISLVGANDTTLAWTLTVRNGPIPAGNTGTLTGTTITGLGMFTLSEVQRFTVQARSGQYILRIAGFGAETGLPESSFVLRRPGYAEVVLDYSFDGAAVAARLREAYGSLDLNVAEARTLIDVTYTVTFVRGFSGIDFAQITWRPLVLAPSDLLDLPAFATALASGTTDPTMQLVRSRFSAAGLALLDSGTATPGQLRDLFIDEFNAIIDAGIGLYDAVAFAGVALRPETLALVAENPIGFELNQLNRMLLEDLFGGAIADTMLVPNEDSSAFVTTGTVRDGTTVPGVGVTNQQVLQLDASAGTFRLGFRLTVAAIQAIEFGLSQQRDGEFVIQPQYVPEIDGLTVWTAPIPHDASADEIARFIQPILDPANSNLDLPHTDNFSVSRVPGALVLTFQGQYAGLSIYPADIDTSALTGTIELPPQTLSIHATGGVFRIGLRLDPLNPGAVSWTQPIAYDASADEVLAALDPLLNPANATTPLTDAPNTQNVAVTRQGSVFVITFQGAAHHVRIHPLDVDASLLDLVIGEVNARGTATLGTQLEGIHYFAFEVLNIDLSAGSDIFNIRGTAAGAVTNVRSHDGDDRFYVSSQADRRPENIAGYDYLNGDLDDILGTLNIDGGAGRQVLMISDESSTVGDPAVLITDSPVAGLVDLPTSEIRVVGLAPAPITFGATPVSGNFAGGVTLWSGFGDDTITIDGTHRRDGLRTITTLNTGLGNDSVAVALTEGEDDFFVLNTQGAYHNRPSASDDDTVDASASTLPLIIFGGQGNDTLRGGLGDDIIFGDRGRVLFLDGDRVVAAIGHAGPGDFTDGVIRPVTLAFTEYPAIGGDDTIFGNQGRDLLLGGAGGDRIFALSTDSQPDVLVGDNGFASFVEGVLVEIRTTHPAIGGDDELVAGLGANLLIGGAGNDAIAAGGDLPFDIAFGDNARVLFDAITGLPFRAETIDPAIGGSDTITGGDSSNILFGGAAGDTITTLNPTARTFVLGDNGAADFDASGRLVRLVTIDPAIGGNDTITTGAAPDIIAGGAADDTIRAGAGDDFVLGDNGLFLFDPAGVLTLMTVIDPTIGGSDTIHGEDGEDYLFGGTGSDTIFGGAGHDIILGDHGRYEAALPRNQNFLSIFTSAADGGGDDLLDGGDGDDFILGQQGGDRIFGGDGQDDIIGGHNVLFGADGDDYIDGGAGDDVVLGDNGIISRQVLPGTPSAWRTYPAPFDSVVIRTVVRFDDIDFIAGNDILLGGDGQDILFGQRGSDVIDGGAGDDEIIGGLGADTLMGGDGSDVILGDAGQIIRAFNPDGTPRLNTNGTWHRDIVLEDVGTISHVIKMDVHPLRLDDPALATKLILADLALLGGVYLPGGARLVNGDSGAWDTELILIDLVAADDDIIDGGAGDDLLFGQRGSDTMLGGAGDDLIFADGAFNSVPFGTNLPVIVSAVRLIGSDAGVPYEIPAGGTLIVPAMALQPLELNTTAPQLHFVPNGVFGDLAAADALRRHDGAYTEPLITFVPDLTHHSDALPGNDIIDGGPGADTIFADDVAVSSPLFSGLGAIDRATEDVRQAVFSVLSGLRHLSLDFDLLQQLTGGPLAPHTIRIGNDTIRGGDGDDFIFGDNAILFVPFATGNPLPAPDFTTSALRYHHFLRDLEYVLADFLGIVLESHAGVLHHLVDAALEANPNRDPKLRPAAIDPNYHRIFLGNDTIDGGAGNDVIVGDQGAIVAPVLSGQIFGRIAETLGITPQELRDVQAALNEQQKLRAAELAYHLATHQPDWNSRRPDTADLRLVPAVFEYDLDIGNDVIHGGTGNDLLIGDKGLVVLPVINDPSLTLRQVQSEIGRVLNELETLLGGQKYSTSYRFSASALGHAGGAKGVALRGYVDTLMGGAGDDVLFSRTASVVVPFSSLAPDQLPQLTFTFSHIDFELTFLNIQPWLAQGRTVLKAKDSLTDTQGQNKLLKQTGNLPRKTTLLLREMIFSTLTPQIREFLVDAGATGGIIRASGDVAILPPAGSIVREPTLAAGMSVEQGNTARTFDFTALLGGLAIDARYAAVWQVLDGAGEVIASGTGTDFRFKAPRDGDYSIRLTLLDLNTGEFGSSAATIRVNSTRGAFSAGLSGPSEVFAGQAAAFVAMLDGITAPGEFSAVWQVFDSANNVVDGAVTREFAFIPSAPGAYTVQLTLTNPLTGASESASLLLTVKDGAPTLNAGILGPLQGLRGALQTFDATLDGAQFDGNFITTWLVLDHKHSLVATGRGSQLLFLPSQPGEYTVHVQVVDPVDGTFGVHTMPLTIRPLAAEFSSGMSGPIFGLRGEQSTFAALVDGAALPATYSAQWEVLDAGGGRVASAQGAGFVFTPAAIGSYTVRLTITDHETGASGVSIGTLAITEPATLLTAGISGPTSAAVGQVLTFGGIVSGLVFDSGVVANWAVLDGAGAIVKEATGHAFSFALDAAGEYTVRFHFADPVSGGAGEAALILGVASALPPADGQQTIGIHGPALGVAGQRLDYAALAGGAFAGGGFTLTWRVLDASADVIATGSGETFAFTPAASGAFDVEVRTTDSSGILVATASTPLTVAAAFPVIGGGIAGPVEALPGQLRTFRLLVPGGLPAGVTAQWQAFSPSAALIATGAGAEFTFAPAVAGVYEIRLVLQNSFTGAAEVRSTALRVSGTVSPLGIHFIGPAQALLGQPLLFTGLAEGRALPAGYAAAWTVLDSASAVAASGAGSTLAFTPSQPGRYWVQLDVLDPATGARGTFLRELTVSPATATLDADIDGPLTALRGQPLVFTGLLDGAPITAPLFFAWNATNESHAVVAQGASAQFTFAPAEPGTYLIQFTVFDPATSTLGTAIVPLTVSPLNPAPTTPLGLSLDGPLAAVRGQVVAFQALLGDSIIAGPYDGVWRVLDPTGAMIATGRGNGISFAPRAEGLHTLEFSLANTHTGALLSATTTLDVQKVLLIPDGAAPGAFILLAGGSVGGDIIEFTTSRDGLSLILTIDERTLGTEKFTQEFTLAEISRIEAYGGMGDDRITIHRSLPALPTLLDGGPGRDTLEGGTGADTLRGGFGDDILLGGDGDDVLDGGHGSDTLRGGDGNDFLAATLGGDLLLGEAGDDIFHLRPMETGARMRADGGAGDDIFHIPGSAPGSQLAVLTGPGENRLYLGTAAGALPGTGGVLDALKGRIDIAANRNDIVHLDDTAAEAGRALHISANALSGLGSGQGSIHYRSLGQLDISLGAGHDQVTLSGTGATTTNLRTADGNDAIRIEGAGSRATTNIDTGAGANTLLAGGTSGSLGAIHGTVNILGQGSDVLSIDGSGSRRGGTGTLTSSGFSGFGISGGGLHFSGIASLGIKLGSGADRLTVESTPAIPVSIDLGAGNDSIFIRATTGPLAVQMGEGNDKAHFGSRQPRTSGALTDILGAIQIDGGTSPRDRDHILLDDTGTTTGSTGVIDLTTITGLGLGSAITYTGIETIQVNLGAGDDDLTLADGSAAYTKVNPGRGNNTIRS